MPDPTAMRITAPGLRRATGVGGSMQRMPLPPGIQSLQERRGHRQRLDSVEQSISNVADTIGKERRLRWRVNNGKKRLP